MTARTKLTVLDRLHTFVTIAVGALAVFAVGLNMPRNTGVAVGFALMVIVLAVGYGAAYLADIGFAHAVQGRREQLMNAIRKAHPEV